MRTVKIAAAVFASVMFCAQCPLAAAPAMNDPATRVARWEEDLDYFAAEFPAKQKDFYLLTPKDTFERDVAELKRQAADLSDSEIIFGLMRIVASLGVAHTSIAFGSISGTVTLHPYPLEMRWFSDGLAVVAASPEYQAALGCRVARLGSKTPEEVEAALAPYIPHENEAYLRFQSPRYLAMAELMEREQIVDRTGHLRLTCAKADGGTLTLDLAPGQSSRTRRDLVRAETALHIPNGFCRKHPDASYWYEYLPDTQTFYIQYSKCRNEPGNPFVNFVGNLVAFADTRPIQRVIVDLRFNAGGSSSILQPLIEGLRARPAMSAKGHLYALIGSETFSSGLMAAMDFRDRLHAILVGGPTGNKPNHYGEQKNFTLPNSRLLVHYSTKHFLLVRDADPSTLVPDIAILVSLNDFLSGRDPVLEAALHQPLP
jgi:hypothetical protein